MESIEIISLIIVLISFLSLPFALFSKKADLLGYALIAAVISCMFTTYSFGVSAHDFIDYVRFPPLIYIIAMNIIVIIMDQQGIFQVLAVETIRISKSNPRTFFYIMCIFGALFSTVMEDVSVAIIFMPLVVRAAMILKNNTVPYFFGIAICLNIGDIFAPFSNSQNIIITDAFDLDFAWFAKNIIPFFFICLLVTVIVLDKTLIKHHQQQQPSKAEKEMSMELLSPSILIANKRNFIINVIIFASTIVFLVSVPQAYVVALIGSIVLCLVNKKTVADTLKTMDWKLIGFLISLFLLVGCMIINGSMEFVGNFIAKITTSNIFVASIIILILCSIITSFTSTNPVSLFFIPIFQILFDIYPSFALHPEPILIAFILGINLGGNMLPEGAPAYLATISLAEQNKVTEVNYKTMQKVGLKYSFFHMGLIAVYLFFYCWIYGLL
jgi:Na+/H+ antiporter NhaD/arsenite permease-like protein